MVGKFIAPSVNSSFVTPGNSRDFGIRHCGTHSHHRTLVRRIEAHECQTKNFESKYGYGFFPLLSSGWCLME